MEGFLCCTPSPPRISRLASYFSQGEGGWGVGTPGSRVEDNRVGAKIKTPKNPMPKGVNEITQRKPYLEIECFCLFNHYPHSQDYSAGYRIRGYYHKSPDCFKYFPPPPAPPPQKKKRNRKFQTPKNALIIQLLEIWILFF